MITGSLPKRYARGLIGYAQEHKLDLEKLHAELAMIATHLQPGGRLHELMINRMIPARQASEAFDQVLKNVSFSKTASHFLQLLHHKGRLLFLPDIMTEFRRQADALEGIVRGEVITAAGLSEKTLKSLTENLSKAMSKKVTLTVRTNPAIIGGLIVKVGSLSFDGSLRAFMNNIREKLIEEVNP